MVILRDTATPASLETPIAPTGTQPTVTRPTVEPPPPQRAPEEARQDVGSAAIAPSYYGLSILPPFTAIIELGAIVAALLAIDWIWPALDINAMQPNPYWLPVLLLTLQYGTASGTLAVIVAIAAYFAFFTLPEQGVGENEFAYRLRILANPILWIATAVVLGQFRMIQISAKRELTRRLGELETQRSTLADYANRLRTRCDALERDIASRPFYAGIALLDALASVRRPSQTPKLAIANVLAAAFPEAAISLFLRDGAALRQAVASGWTETSSWAVSLPADHGLSLAILGLGPRAPLSVLRAADEAILQQQGLAAVPVFDPRSGKVQGMIKLEFADARLLTPECLAQMGVIAAAIAPLLIEQGDGIQISKNGVFDTYESAAAALANGKPVSTVGKAEFGHERPPEISPQKQGDPSWSTAEVGR